MKTKDKFTGMEVAIIGMSCHFPDANTPDEFWANLVSGKDSVCYHDNQTLANLGYEDSVLNDPNFIKAEVPLKGKELFDNNFFGYRYDEATFMNPQLRIFHKCTWEALEDAGYIPNEIEDKVGVFAAAGQDLNWRFCARIVNSIEQKLDDFSISLLSSKDSIATYIAHKFNMNGPAINVSTACSSSITAIHLACRSLLTGSAKMAIAGGVNVDTSTLKGYYYQEGMVNSPDGHCKTFDENANGIIVGQGCGILVLKRLKDALKDKDQIHAVIRATAVNNDGNDKVGYTAPSVQGQAKCIRTAIGLARIPADSISYIEAHGTGTPLGDPIEIEALKLAFGTTAKQFCAIGSVKTNIGHLDAAAGLAGVIKTVLALKNRQLPPSLHFEKPNPKIYFEESPFFVNDSLRKWEFEGKLRAGVSSFGIGGTNGHVILEEAPSVDKKQSEVAAPRLLITSGKSKTAAQQNAEKLVKFYQEGRMAADDLAYQLMHGKKQFAHRLCTVVDDRKPGLEILDADQWRSGEMQLTPPKMVWLLPGQGVQYPGVWLSLYKAQTGFRAQVDNCFKVYQDGGELKAIWTGEGEQKKLINQTKNTQPLLFILEYALGKWLLELGLKPDLLMGHSLGELSAACLSGIFTLEDGLRIVKKRGALMNSPRITGAMLCVLDSELVIRKYLDESIELAAANTSKNTVLSGTMDKLKAVKEELKKNGIASIFINKSKAFHSYLTKPILEEFRDFLKDIEMKEPQIPIVSNLLGRIVLPEEIATVDYWVNQIRQTVQFKRGLENIAETNLLFLEIGPGQTLSNFVRATIKDLPQENIIAFGTKGKKEDQVIKQVYNTLGDLWVKGMPVDWSTFYQYEVRAKKSIPTYAFDQIAFPAEYDYRELLGQLGLQADEEESDDPLDWEYTQRWQSASDAVPTVDLSAQRILLYSEKSAFTAEIQALLGESGAEVKICSVNNLSKIKEELEQTEWYPHQIICCGDGNLLPIEDEEVRQKTEQDIPLYYDNLIIFLQELLPILPKDKEYSFNFLTKNCYRVLGYEPLAPLNQLAVGVLRCIPNEFPYLNYRVIDVGDLKNNRNCLAEELGRPTSTKELALRFGKAWQSFIVKREKGPSELIKPGFKKGETYLITGASKGIGEAVSLHVAEKYQANLVLLSRSSPTENHLEQLSTLGVSYTILLVDLSDGQAVQKALSTIDHLTVDGVINCAGIGDEGGMINNRILSKDRKVLAAKVFGTVSLLHYFNDKSLRFFISTSSLAASVGSTGEVAYVAANAFLDGLALGSDDNLLIQSIQYNRWNETGLAVKAFKEWSSLVKTFDKNNLSTKQGLAILERVIASKTKLYIVSSRPVNQIIKALKVRSIKQATAQGAERKYLERPSISVAYQAPESDLAIQVHDIWKGLLGIESIGMNDDFFELGGDSLSAMNLLNFIHKEVEVEIKLSTFFDEPTISGMVEIIENIRWLKVTDVKFDNQIVI